MINSEQWEACGSTLGCCNQLFQQFQLGREAWAGTVKGVGAAEDLCYWVQIWRLAG